MTYKKQKLSRTNENRNRPYLNVFYFTYFVGLILRNKRFRCHFGTKLRFDNKINAINLKSLKVFAGTGEPQRADMTLDVFGDIKKTSQTGDGPVDAIFKCIKELYPHDVKLSLYQVHAVTEGTDAQATVSVKIEENDRTTVGQSADTDTLVASANAYLNALNKMLIKREKKSLYKNIEPKKLKESI